MADAQHQAQSLADEAGKSIASASSIPTTAKPSTPDPSSSTSTSTPEEPATDPSQEPPADDAPSITKCAHCARPSPSRPCPKCQTALYCGRECTKAGYKVHKKVCAAQAQIYAQTATFKPAAAPRVPKRGDQQRGLQKWQFDT